MKEVKNVYAFSDGVWAATGGGAFSYSGNGNSFTTLNKAEGLQGIDLTTVASDESGNVWFGSANGIIDIFNPEKNSFRVILDIYNSNHINKSINDLILSGDTIIVSSDFGVSLIDADDLLFFDTFFKFGDFPTNTKVNSTIKIDLIYVCSDEGVAIQKQNAVNLSAPESWNVYREVNGLPSNKTLKAGKFLSDIIVSTDKGFAKLTDTLWVPFLPQFNGKVISDFAITADSLLILAESKIYLYTNNQLTEFYTSPNETNSLSYNSIFGITIASAKGVIHLDASLTDNLLVPNGPAANQFPSTSVGDDEIFWSASGKDGLGVGFYKFDKTSWTNYNMGNTTVLPTNDFYYTYTAPDNTAFLGTWGKGFVTIKDDIIKVFNRQNTGIQGIPANPDFIVISGFGTDSRNNKWVLNYAPSNRKSLSMITPDSTWYHFINPAEPSINLSGIYNLAIDPYDTKFYSLDFSSSKGLFYFNENKTYDDPSDDRSGFISTADGINGDISDVVVDRRGDVWIGTNSGVNVLSNTSAIPSSNDPPLRLSSIFSLREQSINAIAVDPLNQKWVGTNEGLLLVNSDGSRLLAALYASNTALLSDKIQSISIDENAGIVYVGTEEGLTSFETPFIKPQESFDELFVYPNPFIIKDNSKLLTIDGLIRDTDIKILTVTGNLITEFSSPGGRTAYWDGADDNGKLVSSGIYLIVAFDSDGNNIITGKVAVIRE
ncbi:MAG: hypothetical protein DRQ13_00490 [Ignavibacteriae bacterium]|nr:MAG: hypothetical protein DRQ13_00490 [Ignavibacteriota bacterium]